MDCSSLSNLISVLEQGRKLHICVAFLNNYGNRKTHCTSSQTIHDSPVCLHAKKTQEGLSQCYRCRMTVQKAVVRSGRSMGGFCAKGVYEYCRPVIFNGQVIAIIFIGNILTNDPEQRKRLLQYVDPELLRTMESDFAPEDCEKIADILESYISFLFDKFGNEDLNYDPLLENIKNYIRENLAYDLTMAEIAAAFNYSEKHLGRLFKSRAGCTVKEYINMLRVSQAKRMLLETSLTVAEIAFRVGFNNVTYFDRVFRRIARSSPRSFRTVRRIK